MGLARKGTGKRGMEEKSLLEQNKSKVTGKDIQNKEEAVSMMREQRKWGEIKML